MRTLWIFKCLSRQFRRPKVTQSLCTFGSKVERFLPLIPQIAKQKKHHHHHRDHQHDRNSIGISCGRRIAAKLGSFNSTTLPSGGDTVFLIIIIIAVIIFLIIVVIIISVIRASYSLVDILTIYWPSRGDRGRVVARLKAPLIHSTRTLFLYLF